MKFHWANVAKMQRKYFEIHHVMLIDAKFKNGALAFAFSSNTVHMVAKSTKKDF